MLKKSSADDNKLHGTSKTANIDNNTEQQQHIRRSNTAPSTLETTNSNRFDELRQKSVNLRRMSDAISQNLNNMKQESGSPNKATTSTSSPPKEFSFPTLPESKSKPLEEELDTFLTHHLSFHRPIALVTSGGTITTLEQNTIRYLDNFSTGQRGAISVEEFCKRGYAVIHLWRKGSTAPYSRVLSKLLGCKQGNHALDYNALGYLFDGQGGDVLFQQTQRRNEEKDARTKNDDDESTHDDPWLTATKRSKSYPTKTKKYSNNESTSNRYSTQNRMNLTTHILHNNLLQRKLRERSDVLSNNLLFTIPFTTIEEYLALLKLTTEAMDQCQSLGLIYLAAAVSDFYIPNELKCVHKIQSRDYGLDDAAQENGNHTKASITTESAIIMNQSNNTLSLTLQPVPKVIRQIREQWSPHAYCVSFKLETDDRILKQKAHGAMKKYDVHMVIGNILQTRHDKVSLFERKEFDFDIHNNDNEEDEMEVTDVTKSSDGEDDDLEENIISHVVEKHFEYIANHYLLKNNDDNVPRTALMTGAEAAAKHNAFMRKKKEAMKNEIKMKRLRDTTLNILGHLLGCYLTYTLSSALQRRL